MCALTKTRTKEFVFDPIRESEIPGEQLWNNQSWYDSRNTRDLLLHIHWHRWGFAIQMLVLLNMGPTLGEFFPTHSCRHAQRKV